MYLILALALAEPGSSEVKLTLRVMQALREMLPSLSLASTEKCESCCFAASDMYKK